MGYDVNVLINVRGAPYNMYNDDPSNLPEIINICATVAKQHNYPFFGIQGYGKCRGILGFADLNESNKCEYGSGKYGIIYIYEFI